MELDARTNVVISEKVASEPGVHSEVPDSRATRVYDPAVDPQLALAQSAHLARLRERGMEFRVGAEGQIDLGYMPPIEPALIRFFTAVHPCFFPECEELRKQWNEFLTLNGADSSECPDCMLGQLMQQFRPRVIPSLQAHINANPAEFTGIQIGTRDREVP